jgi:hypothetical protein
MCTAVDCSPVGSEGCDELITPGACDRETEPYDIEEVTEERAALVTA